MNEFLVGVWAQPSFEYVGPNRNIMEDRIAKWVKRGVKYNFANKPDPNTAGNPIEFYAKWLNDHGMKFFISSDTPEKDKNLPGLAGWMQPDEPDGWNHIIKNPDGTFNMKATTDMYVAAYKKYKAASPELEVVGNFAGGQISSAASRLRPNSNPVCYEDYEDWCKGLDIVSADFYLTNTGRSVEGTMRPILGNMMDRMTAAGKGKPAMACIECSNQMIEARSQEPTPGEFQAQVWYCVMKGAKGIWYFPQQIGYTDRQGKRFGGFGWDVMTPKLAEKMTETNANLAKYGNYFLKGVRQLITNGTTPFEQAQWTLNGKTLKITLNCTASPQTLEARLYQPYEVTISEGGNPPPVTSIDQRVVALEGQVSDLQSRIVRLEAK